MMSFIRPATLKDHDHLADLYLKCRKDSFTWMEPNSFKREDFYQDTQGELILVLEENNKILGFSSSWKEARFLHHLYISPDYQRQGLGSILLKETLKAIGTPAHLKCLTKNLSALEFYKARGWTVQSWDNSPSPEAFHELVYEESTPQSTFQVG